MAQKALSLEYRRFEKYAPGLYASLETLSLGLKLEHLGSQTGLNRIYFKATAPQAPEGKNGFICPRFENYASNLHASLGTLSLGPRLERLGSKACFYRIFFKATARQALGLK